MLEPQSRRLLLESLTPPHGYSLDYAIGTTFSLDLLALLSVPLAFTFSDWEDEEGELTDDNLALLESIKRHAGRICIFCQAGQISVPKKDQRLFAYLEQSVFQVAAPKKFGVFHPKIWLLRYTSSKDPEIRYRLLCLSRNLTFDRSWDTALVMEGALQERKRAFGANNPLGDFIRTLPDLALAVGGGVSASAQKIVDLLQDEVRRVRFELPSSLENKGISSFEEYRFWPIGLSSRPEWPFGDNDTAHRRMLIISPFLKDTFLQRITKNRKGCILISRADELDAISKSACDVFEEVHTLSSTALPEEEEEQDSLTGLHAKLFLMDDGYKARLWTGSANATSAAFPDPLKREEKEKGNVEFLVELVGPKSRFGIDVLLEKAKGAPSFSDLLDPFIPSDAAREVDAVQKRLEDELDLLRRRFARGKLRAVVEPGGGEGYRIRLVTTEAWPGSDDVGVKCWPVTYQEHLAKSCTLGAGELAVFESFSLDALTAFFAFAIEVEREGRKAATRFVVKADLEGVPEGRFSSLLRSLLKNRNQVLRMLLMLLSDQDLSSGGGKGWTPSGDSEPGSGAVQIPLLEALLRALDRDPDKIDRVEALVNDLLATDGGGELLPEGFEAIWPAIRAAREGGK